jgi:hypothetical protein
VSRQKAAGKSQLGGYVTDARKKGKREARKARDAFLSAQDEVRAKRQEYILKGAFPGDLPEHLSDAELELAAAIARTRQQQAMLVKSASKQAAPAGPSRQEVVNKAAADWHWASELLSAPRLITKQLTGPEQRIAAVLEARRDATCSSAERESLNEQLARMRGLTLAGGV